MNTEKPRSLDAHLDMYMAHEDAVIAEIARHFPGFSRAI